MGASWRILVAAITVIVSTLLVTEANAQLAGAVTPDEANRMHDAAIAMDNLDEISRVIHLHGEAANVRGMDDPRIVECVRFQGALLHLDGQAVKARAEFERAAAIAMVRGEYFAAGMSLIEGAFAAESAGESGEAYRLAKLANGIAQGDQVTRQERSLILSRLPRGFNEF